MQADMLCERVRGEAAELLAPVAREVLPPGAPVFGYEVSKGI